MKRIYFQLLFLLILGCEVQAQTSFIDTKLNDYCRATLEKTLEQWDGEINEACVCVMRSSGELLADAGVGYYKGKCKRIHGLSTEAIPCGISRLVLFQAMMDVLSPDYEVDTGQGVYRDSVTCCQIEDDNAAKGGYGRLSLTKCVGLSDVGIILGLEAAFNGNMVRYATSLMRTGIFFTNEYYDYAESYKEQIWRPCAVMYNNPYSTLQQLAWVNAVNNGKIMLRTDYTSSTTPVSEIENKKGLHALREAMRLTVTEGLGKEMNSPYTSVYGHTYVGQPDLLNCRPLYAYACFPFEGGTPSYSIAVYLSKHDRPSGVRIPTQIARKIIDYMCSHGYIEKGKSVTTQSKSLKLHRAEKGR